MSRGFFSFAVPVFLASLFLAQLAQDADAQSGAWAQVKVDAKLSVSRQKEADCQARLQQWFVDKIQRYQHVLDDTAVGKASPRIVDLGDWGAFYKRLLAPPTGTGTTTITFGNVSAASTMEDNREIILPQGRSDAFIDGSPDTCWHEFQHVVVLASEANGRSVAVPRSPWMIYAKPGDDKNEEHIYMEGLGEYTVEWLDLLLHERSAVTGGAAMGFEKHARDAYEQAKQYAARGESISYAVENYCWAKAHDAYCRAWEKTGHSIAPLPLRFRQDYEQICGVHIGFVEEVIKLYMGGALKAADGKPIKVPEWVMRPDPMKSAVIVGHLNDNKNMSGDTLRYGFDVRIMENYRIKERSESLNHGKVLITLNNPDADTKLELSVDGKPIKRSGASGRIDLTGFKDTGTIRVTLVRGRLSSFAGIKRYSISVQYDPDPRSVNGVTMPPFYHTSKAVYYLDVTGAGKASAQAPATGKPGGSPSTLAPANGVWRLQEVPKSKKFDDFFKNQGITADATTADTEVTVDATQVTGPPPKTVKWNSKHVWNHPGQTLKPGTKVTVNVTVSQGSNRNAPWTAMKAWVETKGGMSYGLYRHVSGGTDPSGGSCSLDDKTDTKSAALVVPVPAGQPGEVLAIRFETLTAPMFAQVEFRYVWEAAGAAPAPGKADATLTAEEPPTQPEPPEMDNVPPGPGEVVKIPPDDVKEPPSKPTKKAPADQWYVHPSGDYKFKLAAGWKIRPKTFFDEKSDSYDTLFPADEEMAIVCDRSYTDHGSKSADSVLSDFSAKMRKKNPGLKSERIKLGGAEAVSIADFDADSHVMTWHVAIAHKGRSYFISVNMPSGKSLASMPDPPAWMLGSMVMAR